jgi:hypothetical protein
MTKQSLKLILRAIHLSDRSIGRYRYPEIPDKYKAIGRPTLVGRVCPDGKVNREWLLTIAPPNATHYILGESSCFGGFLVQYYSVRK